MRLGAFRGQQDSVCPIEDLKYLLEWKNTGYFQSENKKIISIFFKNSFQYRQQSKYGIFH